MSRIAWYEFFQNSSTEIAKKADLGPIFPGLVAVLCATDFHKMYHFGLRRQRAFHKKCFSKIKKFNSLYYTLIFICSTCFIHLVSFFATWFMHLVTIFLIFAVFQKKFKASFSGLYKLRVILFPSLKITPWLMNVWRKKSIIQCCKRLYTKLSTKINFHCFKALFSCEKGVNWPWKWWFLFSINAAKIYFVVVIVKRRLLTKGKKSRHENVFCTFDDEMNQIYTIDALLWNLIILEWVTRRIGEKIDAIWTKNDWNGSRKGHKPENVYFATVFWIH